MKKLTLLKVTLLKGRGIAESFLLKNFGDIGTFGDMGTVINFFGPKMKNA